jgi:hypothetical protein
MMGGLDYVKFDKQRQKINGRRSGKHLPEIRALSTGGHNVYTFCQATTDKPPVPVASRDKSAVFIDRPREPSTIAVTAG